MLDYFTDTLAAVRRKKRSLILHLVVVILAGVATIALTARNIEIGTPWLMNTVSGVTIAFWAVFASRLWGELETALADEHKLQGIVLGLDDAVGTLRDIGMPDDLLRAFGMPSPDPTPVPEPSPAPDTNPAPAPEPEPKP
jgi:hypothetical protein